MFASTIFAILFVREKSILYGAAVKINTLTSAPRLCLRQHTPDTLMLRTVRALRILRFFHNPLRQLLEAGGVPWIFSSPLSLVQSGRIFNHNQGGNQIREDFKARRISDARCISHLLYIPREDVTAKCCI
jgi:hypothetical protein